MLFFKKSIRNFEKQGNLKNCYYFSYNDTLLYSCADFLKKDCKSPCGPEGTVVAMVIAGELGQGNYGKPTVGKLHCCCTFSAATSAKSHYRMRTTKPHLYDSTGIRSESLWFITLVT